MISQPAVMFIMFGALAFVCVHPVLHSGDSTSRSRAADTLRVVLVVDDTVARRSLVRGARLGAEEASHTGALFGMPVALGIESPASTAGTASVHRPAASRSPHPSVYIVAGDARTCSSIMFQSASADHPVLDAGCASADVAPGRNVYSLVPSDTARAPGDSSRLELWHWSLERFGGEQLNERYRRRFGARMDSEAWTGWIAMKIALDAALHAQSTSGPALLRQLANPRAQYDGQKGRPLRFDPGTRQLIQPRYRVAGEGDAEHVVAEVEP